MSKIKPLKLLHNHKTRVLPLVLGLKAGMLRTNSMNIDNIRVNNKEGDVVSDTLKKEMSHVVFC